MFLNKISLYISYDTYSTHILNYATERNFDTYNNIWKQNLSIINSNYFMEFIIYIFRTCVLKISLNHKTFTFTNIRNRFPIIAKQIKPSKYFVLLFVIKHRYIKNILMTDKLLKNSSIINQIINDIIHQ